MGWSATINAETVARAREALLRARREIEEELDREVAAAHARYEAKVRPVDEELGDLDSFERVAKKLAGSPTATPASPSAASPEHIAPRSVEGEIGAVTPSQKEMVLHVVRHRCETGVARPEIIELVQAKYGIEISPGNVTTALYRLKSDDGLVRNEGRLWFPASPEQGALLEEAATSSEQNGCR